MAYSKDIIRPGVTRHDRIRWPGNGDWRIGVAATHRFKPLVISTGREVDGGPWPCSVNRYLYRRERIVG
jgi:hypothetical protein